MAEPIGPGDMVECISRSPEGESRLTVGAIYQVEAVGIVPAGYIHTGLPFVRLVGLPPHDGNFGYWAGRFRPISRRSDFESILNTLKQPAPERELQPA